VINQYIFHEHTIKRQTEFTERGKQIGDPEDSEKRKKKKSCHILVSSSYYH
jgi:hypothetical protein